jgi:hypothetical protein
MFKFIFFLLIIIFVVATVPKVRNRIVPPILNRLGPVGVKLETPMKRWEAQAECDRLLRELKQAAVQGKTVPAPNAFYDWARATSTKPNTGKDPWGERYWLKPGRSIMTCGSNGPDTQRGTPDDVSVNTSWQL